MAVTVSKDGRESEPCRHPSRRIANAMLLRMRFVVDGCLIGFIESLV
jgi:hypothetical protein